MGKTISTSGDCACCSASVLYGAGNEFIASSLYTSFAAWWSISAVEAFSASSRTLMVIKENGTLWGIGYNESGKLGLPSVNSWYGTFTQVGTDTDWVAIACNDHHTLALKSDGTLWVTGRNGDGQLGLGDTDDRAELEQVGSGTDWAAIAAGGQFSMAIKSAGTLWATGRNDNGQLGLGHTTSVSSFTQVGSSSDWVTLSCGERHAAGVRGDGTLWTVGFNDTGQLGQGDTTERTSFTQVGSATDWASVSCSRYSSETAWFTMAIRTTGTLWSTGWNFYGQLGLDDTTDRSSFTQVGSATEWQSVSCGHIHALARKTSGTLWASGDGGFGKLGVGDTTSRDVFTQDATTSTWAAMEASLDWSGAIK